MHNMPYRQDGYYYSTSPPVVANGVVVVAGSVNDNYDINSPSGVIRAYDARTGKLVWNWDPANPDQTQPIAPEDTYSTSSPNSWSIASADKELGMVYFPMGNRTPDQLGMYRTPEEEIYASSVVALSLETGDALIPITEQEAPQGTIEGDYAAPTQPLSALSFRPPPLKASDMWGATAIDQMICRIKFHSLRYEGQYTPPSVQGTIVYPGSFGVFNWGGVAVDPERQVMFGMPLYMAFTSRLVPKNQEALGPTNTGHHHWRLCSGLQAQMTLAAERNINLQCEDNPSMKSHRQPVSASLLKQWLTWLVLLCSLATPIYGQDETDTKSDAEASVPAVQPELEAETESPPKIELQESMNADIRQQIQALKASLNQRLTGVESSVERLDYAESILNRLKDEYESFELRLETAGLNLTGDYAGLLKQRLERLRRQSIASELIKGIEEQLSTAREEQLRLEEYEAIVDPEDNARGQLRSERARLIRQLHEAVTQHIDVLNDYYNTVTALQEQVLDYQTLLQQRLFWLPNASRVGSDTLSALLESFVWLASELRLEPFSQAIKESFDERRARIIVLFAILALLLFKRRAIKTNLKTNGEYVGNVGRDRVAITLFALIHSVLLTLPGVLALAAGALLLMEGNEFFSALSNGFTAAAFITLLLNFIHKVARKDGLGDRHFHWNKHSLEAIRREIPILLAVVIPITILSATTATPSGSEFEESLGRLLFIVVSVALAIFAQRIMSAVRAERPGGRFLFVLHFLAVATPLVLAAASILGYHYTALELERNLFISICWLAFNALLFYLGLRMLAVRERRLTLERLREQRAAERKMAEAREAAESSGEGVPQTLDMPEMDLKDISQQSTSLLKILVAVVAISGLWLLWANVIPALQLFDNITLWTITTDLEGGDPLPITLGDLMLALLVGAGTVLAVKNLPGTLEVMILSRMHLEPGSGYAITTITTYLIVFLGVVICLGVVGVQWSKLQWLVAALGVGLGFGLQEIVANFVSGIILLFERPIRVGDTVTIGGITGTVSRIRIRATTLVDWDRKEQIVPNKTFVTQDLTNWTLSDPITRVILRVGVAYGSDVDTVQQILMEVANGNERVVDDPAPAVFCVGLGDSSIDFEVRVFVKDLLDIMPLSHEIHASVTKALREAGIEIPFPQRDLHVRTIPDLHGLTGSDR